METYSINVSEQLPYSSTQAEIINHSEEPLPLSSSELALEESDGQNPMSSKKAQKRFLQTEDHKIRGDIKSFFIKATKIFNAHIRKIAVATTIITAVMPLSSALAETNNSKIINSILQNSQFSTEYPAETLEAIIASAGGVILAIGAFVLALRYLAKHSK